MTCDISSCEDIGSGFANEIVLKIVSGLGLLQFSPRAFIQFLEQMNTAQWDIPRMHQTVTSATEYPSSSPAAQVQTSSS